MAGPRISQSDRYTRRIGEQSGGAHYGSAPDVLSGFSGVSAAAGGTRQAVENMFLALQKKQDETDMLRVEEADTELTKRLMDCLNHPETGILNRKGGGAIGENSVTAEFEKASKDIAGAVADGLKLNPRQRAAFQRKALNTAMPFYKQAHEHEAAQGEAYKKAQTAANIEANTQMILAAPSDAETFENGWEKIRAGIELEMAGAPAEAAGNAIKRARSALRSACVGQLMANDLTAAEEMMKAYGDELLPEAASKLAEALEERLGAADVERAFSGAWDTYGMDERSGSDAIDGDEKLTPAQKSRAKALYQAKIADENRFDAREEADWFSATRDAIVSAGSLEAAIAAINRSNADGWRRVQLEGIAAQAYRPEAFKDDIRDWAQAYEEVNSGAFSTQEELLDRWSGRLTGDTLEYFVKMFFKEGKGGSGKGGVYAGDSTSDVMQKTMRELGYQAYSQEWALFVTFVGDEIAAKEEELGRRLKPLEKYDLIKASAKEHTLVQGIWDTFYTYQVRMAESGGYTYDYARGGFYRKNEDGGWEKFDLKKEYTLPELRPSEAAAANRARGLPPLEPRQAQAAPPAVPGAASGSGPLRMPDGSEIGARKRSRPGAAKAGGAKAGGGQNSLVASMAPAGSPPIPGNGYGAPRDGGKRAHKARDIPAPAGSEILSADFGTPLTVIDKRFSASAGNMIILEGTTPDKKKLRVRLLHLDSLDGPETGAAVASGGLLGYVGNTGSTSQGAHMHIDVEVDGERVDPEEYLRGVQRHRDKGIAYGA